MERENHEEDMNVCNIDKRKRHVCVVINDNEEYVYAGMPTPFRKTSALQ